MLGVVYELPVPTKIPPVKASYQVTVPAEAVAPKVTVPCPQTDPGVVPVMVGLALTVTVCVTELLHKTATPPMV